MTKCSHFDCGRDAIVREAWYDDPDEVPSFASGEVHYCAKHARRHGDGFE